MADEPENQTLMLLREIRAELREHRSMLLLLAENGRQLDRRISGVERRIDELKTDLELMLKSELMGRLAHFETRIEQMVEQRLAERRPE